MAIFCLARDLADLEARLGRMIVAYTREREPVSAGDLKAQGAMTVLLKAKISRFLNIFFGVVYTLMMLLIAFTSFTKWYGFYVLYAFLESFLTMTIIWQAWHWPKAE